MELIEKHKALIITTLITGIVVMMLFSFHITKQQATISESYYEMEPPTPEEIEELKELEALEEALGKTTNQAYNEDQEFKDMMKNFKSMNANDFEKTTQQLEEVEAAEMEANDVVTSTNTFNGSGDYSVNQDELERYKKAKDMLAMKTADSNEKNANNNPLSTLTYSLKGRELLSNETPRYLCEDSGKIVVNITVNNTGDVTDAYINKSSTSTNQCLLDHALEYAKSAQFNNGSSNSQLGSITFYFKGK
ncbi:energy transducer TonB [Mangrovimonas sp. TPBH4]|uniref:energy transducer TonB family protein n=1 Tax=Mangrovimonas sp. TPBH4 TaxID=1645914 RepID=UPI0006B601E9|nr:energy transducer TonB [Mangrovimonas sp. TPBH4]